MARPARGAPPRNAQRDRLHATLAGAVHAFNAGDDRRAMAACRTVLAREPRQPDALNLLGALHLRNGATAKAFAALSRAVRAAPGNAEAHSNLGAALNRAERFAEAEARLRQAIALAPGLTGAHVNLGNALKALGRRDEAAACYRRALDLAPGHDGARRGLAALLHEACRAERAAGRRPESLARIEAALAVVPESARYRCDRGLLLAELGRWDEALSAFDAALAFDPDDADATFGRALVNLATGRFGAAWPDYRARESLRDPADRNSLAAAGTGFRGTPLPRDMAGRRVLVVGDQGLGDELFFLRFARALRARGAYVLYRPDARLAAMLMRAGVVDRIVGAETPSVAAADRIAIGDLPFLLGHRDADPLPPSLNLAPLPERAVAMRRRLAAHGPAPYIGVTWRAGTAGRDRLLSKAVPLDRLAGVLVDLPGTPVVLQRDPAAGEIEALAHALRRPVADLSAFNTDLEAMLALTGLLDRYIAVSNTNVHLRAARGRPSHVLVPWPVEFRWRTEGARSPWFPECPLYRQRPDGDWGPAVDALRRDLAWVCRP